MKEDVYRQLVTIIRENAGWVKVVDVNGMQTCLSIIGGRYVHILVRCLVLQVFYRRGSYHRGHVFTIPVHDLHTALRRLEDTDPSFRERLAQHRMIRWDVERIVLSATHGVIRLELSDDWISSFGKN